MVEIQANVFVVCFCYGFLHGDNFLYVSVYLYASITSLQQSNVKSEFSTALSRYCPKGIIETPDGFTFQPIDELGAWGDGSTVAPFQLQFLQSSCPPNPI